ncbi:CIA30 family protein [Flavobacterium sp.]|jgi:NADH dehydrogenase [ubiquinone] 1 alpha subcomplex assembly factor 1|uniref:CIA30 family protein n=1 Tax=Flavobacterium sp. TaxID=239 RepID=UPI0037C04D97
MQFILLFSILLNPILLFDFSKGSNLSNWKVVDDGVMGGVSSSDFFLDSNGNGIFKGTVSTENNGGFCSVRHFFNPIKLTDKSVFKIRLKGDGKKYQFRVKKSESDYYSYICEFQTSTEWETIEIPVTKLYASFRGRTLQLPNYDGQSLEEIAFLIGNKTNENFELLIDKIEVE